MATSESKSEHLVPSAPNTTPLTGNDATREHRQSSEILPQKEPPPESTLVQEGAPAILGESGLPSIPGFVLLGTLARGGMGIVYTARDLVLHRQVALKTLLPEFSHRSDLAAQFDREARITAQLQHPGVPPVHTLGTLPDGRPFLAMKLIRGRTLHAELETIDRSASLPRLLGVFEQICQTVGYAHSLGIIHRDLKPMNVMVGAFGEVQVMDWGLARLLNEERETRQESSTTEHAECAAASLIVPPSSFLTVAGHTKGTPAYMPPEQAKGEWENVDTRADVFALGGILCTLLTGQAPYTGADTSTIFRKALVGDLNESFSRLENCGADAELVSLCKRWLSPEAANRPASGVEVAEAVAAYRVGIEARARKAETERIAAEARAAEAARGHALAHCTLGNSRRDAGDLPGAIAAYREAIRLDPKEAVVHASLGAALHDSADLPGALAACQEAIRLDSANVAPHHTLGKVLHDMGDRNAAIATYRKALELDPNNGAVLSTLGVAMSRSGSRTEALAAFKEAIRLDPSHAQAHFNLGFALAGAGDLTGAIAAYREAIRLDPKHARAHGNLALALHDLGDVPGAIAAYRETIRVAPDYAAAHLNLGILLKESENLPGAIVAFEDAIRLKPENAQAHFNLGMALADSGNFRRAIATFREAIRLDPEYPPAHFRLGKVLRESGDLPGAIAAYREALRCDPKSASAHFNLGSALHDVGNLDAALACYEEAVKLAPRNATIHTNLAFVHAKKKRYREAIAAAREAIGIDPHLATPHAILGLALVDICDLDGARLSLAEAARLDPAEYGELPNQLRGTKLTPREN